MSGFSGVLIFHSELGINWDCRFVRLRSLFTEYITNMKPHEHKYISGTIGDECEFCGLLKSTIEATEEQDKKLKENLEKYREIKSLHPRELLYRFWNIARIEGVESFRGHVEQAQEAQVMIKHYESEILERLGVGTSHIPFLSDIEK